MANEKPPRNAAELRGDIDRGKAADKVGFPDPSAAPLGTDAEAGAAPPTEEEVERAHRAEVSGRPESRTSAAGPRPVDMEQGGTRRSGRTAVIALAIAVVLGLVVWALLA